MSTVFAAPVFFICLRETIECSIIVAVLLAFLKQTLPTDGGDASVNKRLVRQIWYGIAAGLVIVLAIGGGMIGAFYGLQKDVFSKSEDLWEGIFSVIACVIITLMGAALLRVSKLRDKWRVKIARAVEHKDIKSVGGFKAKFKLLCERYAMFMLPFVTVLREGLEAVVFIGGVGLGLPASSFPLAVVCGLLGGVLVGYILYRGGNSASLQMFLIVSTCFLYLIAAGLFSKAVWAFQNREWGMIVGGDAAEVGSGPGSYDIRKSVWHVNCCNPEINGGGGWGVFNSIFGWTNSATYGSVISYNVYWIVVMIGFLTMGFQERNGHLPFLKSKSKSSQRSESFSETSSQFVADYAIEKRADDAHGPTTATVRELKE